MSQGRRRQSEPRGKVVVFPFDNFGNAGTGAGAMLLADSLREAVDDTEQEPRPTRPHAFANRLDFEEIPFETVGQVARWRETGRGIAKQSLAGNHFTLWLAGNHLGVLPVYDELRRDELVLQFDAHLDCYDLHDTATELSHGNWLRQVAGGGRVVNVGHRDIFLRPADVSPLFDATFPAEAVAINFPSVISAISRLAAKAKRIWIDLDVDAIDPAFAPAVHQPMPIGLTPQQLLAILESVWSERVVGVSISEFDPGRDLRDSTLQLLGWLTEWLLLKRFET